MSYYIYIAALFLSLNAMALAKPTANLDKNGAILHGYDAVSYFDSPQPTLGNPQYSAKIGSALYYFSSEQNKAKFLANPAKYTPAYEGWCATAVAKGSKYKIDPTNFKITDGRLFLFYREDGFFGGDAKKEWLKNETAYIKKADMNWPKVQASEE